MVAFFLSVMLLNCEDSQWLVYGVNQAQGLEDSDRREIIMEIIAGTEPECVIITNSKGPSRR